MIKANDFTYTTKNEGPLYLKMNIPKKMDIKPEGVMEVRIYDGIPMPLEEIYKKIGWKEYNINNSIEEKNNVENNIILTFNHLRMNPILFYEQNIRDSQNVIWTEEYLKQKFNYNNNINNNEINNFDINPLYVNDKCYLILTNYLNRNNDLKSKIGKNKLNVFLEELQEHLYKEIEEELTEEVVINCKFTKKNNPIDICILFFYDKKFRNNIFNNKYNSIAVKLIDNYYEDSHLVILSLIK